MTFGWPGAKTLQGLHQPKKTENWHDTRMTWVYWCLPARSFSSFWLPIWVSFVQDVIFVRLTGDLCVEGENLKAMRCSFYLLTIFHLSFFFCLGLNFIKWLREVSTLRLTLQNGTQLEIRILGLQKPLQSWKSRACPVNAFYKTLLTTFVRRLGKKAPAYLACRPHLNLGVRFLTQTWKCLKSLSFASTWQSACEQHKNVPCK